MKVIERIKEELDQRRPWDKDVAALVEYYEAAEAWNNSRLTRDWRVPALRLQKARAELEKEE